MIVLVVVAVETSLLWRLHLGIHLFCAFLSFPWILPLFPFVAVCLRACECTTTHTRACRCVAVLFVGSNNLVAILALRSSSSCVKQTCVDNCACSAHLQPLSHFTRAQPSPHFVHFFPRLSCTRDGPGSFALISPPPTLTSHLQPPSPLSSPSFFSCSHALFLQLEQASMKAWDKIDHIGRPRGEWWKEGERR